jgi:hypothetical protein
MSCVDRSRGADRDRSRQAQGAPVARALWLVSWLSLAYFALLPASRAPQALHDMIAGMADGEPGWLAVLERNAAAVFRPTALAKFTSPASPLVNQKPGLVNC